MEGKVKVLLISLIILILSGCANEQKQEPQLVDPARDIKISASALINGEKITEEEFNKKFLQIKIAVANTNNFKFDKHIVDLLGKRTLEGMIEAKLIEQELQRLGIKPTNENLDKFVDLAKKAYKDEANFQAELKSLNMSEEDFIEVSKKQLHENTFKKYLVDKYKLKNEEIKIKAGNELYLSEVNRLIKSAKIERNIKSE
jgi:hypothetical protein